MDLKYRFTGKQIQQFRAIKIESVVYFSVSLRGHIIKDIWLWLLLQLLDETKFQASGAPGLVVRLSRRELRVRLHRWTGQIACSDPTDKEMKFKPVRSFVSWWRSVNAVILNIGGGVRFI